MRPSEMDSQEFRTSEAFLRTFKEPKNWKNWGITVAKVLRDYMILIEQTEGHMDFAEAAVVVQNSTCFYSKRVDEVYKIIEDLLTSITHVFNIAFGGKRNDRKDDKTDEGQPKRRKVIKPLEATDLQLLDFVASDNNINVNCDRLGKRQTHEVIFLNTNINGPKKPSTYCPIYQSDGQEICSKDKFRSLGYVSSQGIIDDFTFSESELYRVTDLNHTQHDDSGDFDDCRPENSLIDANFEPMETEPSLVAPEQTLVPPDVEPPLPLNNCTMEGVIDGRGDSPEPSNQFPSEINVNGVNLQPVVKLKKIVDWEEVPFNFQFPSKKLLKHKSVFSLPPALLEMDKKKSRKRKKVPEKNNNEITEATWLDLALQKGANPVSSLEEHCALVEAKKKRAIIAEEAKKQAADQSVDGVPLLDLPPDDDLDDNGQEDLMFGPEEQGAGDESLLIPDADIVAEGDNGAMNASDLAQTLLKNFRDRKEQAVKSAEVAKKVAIWQESILPKLKIAESRTKFDVKEYSQKLLDKFPENDEGKYFPFKHFVGGQPKHQIGRYFLSTLVMANTYNIELRKSNPTPLAVDCLEVKLLSKTRRLSKNFGEGEDV